MVITSKEFIDSAYAECQATTDIGDQMHRRAIAGRPLRVHVHAWDTTANNRNGGMAVTLRIDGQYVDRGDRFVAETRASAKEFADAVRIALADMPPPVSATPGRPVEMEGGKRVNVYLDAASLARAAELGAGNVSEGIRIALSATPNYQ